MEQAKTFVVPDNLCRSAGLGAAWVTNNILSVRAYQHVMYGTEDKPSSFAPCESKIHHIRSEVILESPVLRKLVNESNGTFLSVQKLSGNNVQPELVISSRQYRSIIRACLESLQDLVNQNTGDKREQYQSYMTIFYSIECVWHLCEILLVDTAPGNVVVPQLLDWIRFHFPTYERNAAHLLVGGLGAESQQGYWATVRGLVSQGRTDVVRALLKLHSGSDSSPFKLADNLLRTFPSYSIYGGLSLNEFTSRWHHWSLDCRAQINSKAFASEQNLETVMKLHIGDVHTWQKLRESSTTWYELFPGWLLYTEPAAKWFSLAALARTWHSNRPNADGLKHLDKVILALIESDMHQVIREIQHMSENGWFATHLTDLLYHCQRFNMLDESQTNVTSSLRESLILDYGSMLFTSPGLWQAGLSYLDHCPEYGMSAMELLLPKLALSSEPAAIKALKEAAKRDLHEVVKSICKIRGMQFLRRSRLGNALTWALKSQDRDFATFLADRFLQNYAKEGAISSGDLLDSLGPCMMVSDRLIFLAKYQEFHRLYRTQAFPEAGRLLVSLLDIAPEYFVFTLLTDALPLLECDQPVFSSEDTYTLIQSLVSHCNKDKTNVQNKEIKLIQLATARNLSRALISEGCSIDR